MCGAFYACGYLLQYTYTCIVKTRMRSQLRCLRCTLFVHVVTKSLTSVLQEPNRRRVMPTIKSMTSVSKVAAKFSPQKNIAKAAEKSPRKARYATRRLRRLSRLAQRIPRSNSISPSHDPSSAAASSSHNDDSRHSWTRSNRRRSGMYSP